ALIHAQERAPVFAHDSVEDVSLLELEVEPGRRADCALRCRGVPGAERRRRVGEREEAGQRQRAAAAAVRLTVLLLVRVAQIQPRGEVVAEIVARRGAE